MNKRKNLWAILAVALAVLTIYAVVSQSGGMDPESLLKLIREGKPWYMLLAVAFMVAYIGFEGKALRIILKTVGYQRSPKRGFVYSAGDVYFSAITPSASGGQPASAYFMLKDGIPAAVVAATLLLNFGMHVGSLMGLGAVCLLLTPSYFLRFSLVSRILVGLGFLTLTIVFLLFVLMLNQQNLLFGLAKRGIDFLARRHILRHPEKRLRKLERIRQEYVSCLALMGGHRYLQPKVFLCNVLQRACQYLVVVSVFLAMGGNPARCLELFATQIYISLGSNCTPVPGGVGVTDFLMLDGYEKMFEKTFAFQLEIMGRTMSFYVLILVSALTVLFSYALLGRKKDGHGKLAA